MKERVVDAAERQRSEAGSVGGHTTAMRRAMRRPKCRYCKRGAMTQPAVTCGEARCFQRFLAACEAERR